jgi:hypothetical protein
MFITRRRLTKRSDAPHHENRLSETLFGSSIPTAGIKSKRIFGHRGEAKRLGEGSRDVRQSHQNGEVTEGCRAFGECPGRWRRPIVTRTVEFRDAVSASLPAILSRDRRSVYLRCAGPKLEPDKETRPVHAAQYFSPRKARFVGGRKPPSAG